MECPTSVNIRAANVGKDGYKKTQNWVCREGEVDLGRAVGEGEYVQNMLHEVLKEIIIIKTLKEYWSLKASRQLILLQRRNHYWTPASRPGVVRWSHFLKFTH